MLTFGMTGHAILGMFTTVWAGKDRKAVLDMDLPSVLLRSAYVFLSFLLLCCFLVLLLKCLSDAAISTLPSHSSAQSHAHALSHPALLIGRSEMLLPRIPTVPRGSTAHLKLWSFVDCCLRDAHAMLLVQLVNGVRSAKVTEARLQELFARNYDIFQGVVAKRAEICVWNGRRASIEARPD
jgi:hypothetical protein